MLGNSLTTLGRAFVTMVLPSPCVVCGEELPVRSRKASVCLRCWSSLEPIGGRCSRCAIPLDAVAADETATCIDCIESRSPLDWIDSWGRYSGALEKILHAFKFERHDFLSAPLATLLVSRLSERGETFDAIVAVPMHAAKLRRRGYNQADLLARALARNCAVKSDPALLRRTADRPAQSTLARDERRKNVRGTFEAANAKGLSLLVVDDICTTGETLRACAEVLRKAGAERVAALTVARA